MWRHCGKRRSTSVSRSPSTGSWQLHRLQTTHVATVTKWERCSSDVTQNFYIRVMPVKAGVLRSVGVKCPYGTRSCSTLCIGLEIRMDLAILQDNVAAREVRAGRAVQSEEGGCSVPCPGVRPGDTAAASDVYCGWHPSSSEYRIRLVEKWKGTTSELLNSDTSRPSEMRPKWPPHGKVAPGTVTCEDCISCRFLRGGGTSTRKAASFEGLPLEMWTTPNRPPPINRLIGRELYTESALLHILELASLLLAFLLAWH